MKSLPWQQWILLASRLWFLPQRRLRLFSFRDRAWSVGMHQTMRPSSKMHPLPPRIENDRQTFLCYLKSNSEYKTEVSKYSGATCGWIPGRSNYDLHHTDSESLISYNKDTNRWSNLPLSDSKGWSAYENGDGGVKFREACDFPNAEDVGNKEMPLDKCGRSCINQRGCNAFSYLSGRCFLKNVPQHFSRTETTSSVICGFLPWQFPDASDAPCEENGNCCPDKTEKRARITYKEIELPFGSRWGGNLRKS